MDCGRITNLLSDYIDGQLSDNRRRQVESHLRTCTSCAAELSRLRRTVEAVRSLPELDLPADFHAALHLRLAQAQAEQQEAAARSPARAAGRAAGFSSWVRQGFRRPAWRGAFAAVACLALVFSLARYTLPGWDGNVWSLVNMARSGNLRVFGLGGSPESTPPVGSSNPAPRDTGGLGATKLPDSGGKAAGDSFAAAPEGMGGVTTTGLPDGVSTLGGTQVIRSASLTVEVREFEPSSRQVEDIIIAAGGYIEQSSINMDAKTRSGYFRARVPEPKFSETIRKLEELGKPQRREISAEDVTAPILDLEARISSLRSQELKMAQLLGQAKTLDEVLRVENELTRIRYQIEAYEGQLRYYRNRVSMATIALNLSEPGTPVPPPVPGADLWYRIWQAFVATWKGIGRFTEGLFVFIASVAPVVALLVAARWGYGRYRRSKAGRGTGI
ncbi:MAG: DUF4349 domain-containing protein [Bacillota bacterium]|nr:DUF4349 domain-containing protein [Bacillota bacterium]